MDCFNIMVANMYLDGSTSPAIVCSKGVDERWGDAEEKIPFDQGQMRAILLRPCFDRLWIWQETHRKGKSALLMCGKRTLSMSDLYDCVNCLNLMAENVQDETLALGFRVEQFIPLSSLQTSTCSELYSPYGGANAQTQGIESMRRKD